MQIVYSGGSTPNPSPRMQRKHNYGGYGRPLLPGYLQRTSTPPISHRSSSPKEERRENTDSSLRDSIPAMVRSVAITCLVFNIILPGLGTFTAGLTVLCGSHIRTKNTTKQKVIWANTWVAILQFSTTFLFLLGWIWSVVWGVAFYTISKEFYKSNGHPKDNSLDKDRHNGASHGPKTSTSLGLIRQDHLDKPTILRSSSADQPTQRMIVLQETPVVSRSESALIPDKPILDARTRYQKIHQRQTSDNESSPFCLTQEKLQQIMIHDVPPPPTVRRGVLRREDTVTSNSSTASAEVDGLNV
ncbi:hypothetical protein CHS0354_041034 [Potamilus streckersoni]|uniref:Protein SPEC3 n=1 Tax=Potamilus streckersoni TaxID=2493646 RepID=A0AAE0SWH1_9BIVA|nr:hypothetical protein CHS0354_041034 [Potamilus streckersoni]